MASIGGPNIIEDGLVLYLDAANTRSYPGSGTTWNDLSGNGNSGTLTNGPTFDSVNNGSIVFDGVNDFLVIPFLTNYLNILTGIDFTITTWVNYKTLSINRNGLWGKDGVIEFGPINNTSIQAWSPSGQLTYNISSSEFVQKPTEFTLVNDFNNFRTNLYINGVLVSNGGFLRGGTNLTNFTLMTGAFDSPGARFVNGDIYLFRTYNRVLSPQEILQNYNATKGRFGL